MFYIKTKRNIILVIPGAFFLANIFDKTKPNIKYHPSVKCPIYDVCLLQCKYQILQNCIISWYYAIAIPAVFGSQSQNCSIWLTSSHLFYIIKWLMISKARPQINKRLSHRQIDAFAGYGPNFIHDLDLQISFISLLICVYTHQSSQNRFLWFFL